MKPFKHLGVAVRTIRKDAALTQEQFGVMIGVHKQYVSNCERGDCGLPVKNLRKLVRKFGGSTSIYDGKLRDAEAAVYSEYLQITK